MTPLPFDCVIPAAGLSTRMGGHKLLLDLAGKPLLRWAVDHALQSCRRVIVVTGHNAAAVRDILPETDSLLVVHNPHFSRGMLTSIERGARAVTSPLFFVAPADMPFLTPDIYAAVAAPATTMGGAAAGNAGAGPPGGPAAWFPRYETVHAHPVLISAGVIPGLTEAVGEGAGTGAATPPMRKFLAAYQTADVTVDSPGSVTDVDTTDALDAAAERARRLTP